MAPRPLAAGSDCKGDAIDLFDDGSLTVTQALVMDVKANDGTFTGCWTTDEQLMPLSAQKKTRAPYRWSQRNYIFNQPVARSMHPGPLKCFLLLGSPHRRRRCVLSLALNLKTIDARPLS